MLMISTASLGIVIPVWNLPEDLGNLLSQISQMAIFSEIIISDDGSDVPCDPAKLNFTEEKLGARVVYLRSPEQLGAGHARNIALASVTADNFLFFDADDHLASDLPAIWQQHLDADCPDFTIFRHSDTRVLEQEGRKGTFLAEEERWKAALGHRLSATLNLKEAVELCSISNYPWNKIYRTDFLRCAGITCSETPVHNDIRLHWHSFLRANRIQADSRIGAVHIIQDRDHHLTTRRGVERLCLGPILKELISTIQTLQDRRLFMRQFIQFADDLCRWNLTHIDPEVVSDFKKLMIDFYMKIRPEDFRIFSEWHPDQAEEIVAFLLREGG